MTKSQIFSKAHSVARATKKSFLTYRAAFGSALCGIYQQLRVAVINIKEKTKTFFRIIKADRTIKFAGTGEESCFSASSDAKALCDYSEGEAVYETDGIQLLWEII